MAIFLDETETYEGAADRFMGNSPVSLALAKADADRLPFVVITRGAQIRIYAADKRIVGVGRKGRTETFLEANLALLPTESAGYLPLLFGAEALLPDGTFEQVLERSKNYASDLSKRLRERVYTDVVPSLATAIARRSALAADADGDRPALPLRGDACSSSSGSCSSPTPRTRASCPTRPTTSTASTP